MSFIGTLMLLLFLYGAYRLLRTVLGLGGFLMRLFLPLIFGLVGLCLLLQALPRIR